MQLTSFGVALEAQHDFRSSIPSGGNVFGHVSCILLWVYGKAARQTKVANLEFAIGIDQQITRFEIAMQNVRRVDILETAEDLINEGLEMGVS